jgi:hypothetical protein
MFNPDTGPVSSYMPSFEMAALSLKVEPFMAPVRDDVEIETTIVDLGRDLEGGLVVVPGAFVGAHRTQNDIGGGPKQRRVKTIASHHRSQSWFAVVLP